MTRGPNQHEAPLPFFARSGISVTKLFVMAMSACVYLLRCSDGSLYCGWTTDLERRLKAHNAGKASRYTSRRLPVQLVYTRQMADRSAQCAKRPGSRA